MTEIEPGDHVRPRSGRYARHTGCVVRVIPLDDGAAKPTKIALVVYGTIDGRIGHHDTRYLRLKQKGRGNLRAEIANVVDNPTG